MNPKPRPKLFVHTVVGEIIGNGNQLVLGVLLRLLADAEVKGQKRRSALIRKRVRVVEDRIKKGSLHGA